MCSCWLVMEEVRPWCETDFKSDPFGLEGSVEGGMLFDRDLWGGGADMVLKSDFGGEGDLDRRSTCRRDHGIEGVFRAASVRGKGGGVGGMGPSSRGEPTNRVVLLA